MYEVSNEIRSNILQDMKNVLDNRNYDYSNFALERIMDEWMSRKANLFDLFSQHPNWDANKLMIRFDKDFARELDVRTANRFIDWLIRSTNITTMILQNPHALFDWDHWRLYDIFYWDFTQYTYLQDNEHTVERIAAINNLSENFNFRAGMKVTKVMRKICTHYGWDKIMGTETNALTGEVTEFNAFEREYAKYCDALCPIKVKRHTCISLNPIDFLLMSHGNSWRSCHYIDWADEHPGEYSSGTVSYMLDEHSFVFYTVGADFDGDDIEMEPKLQRQMFGYHNNRLLQSRLYPQSNDCGAQEVYTDIRNIVQKVIADCCGKPNLWVKRSVKDVRKGYGATCYADWYHQGELCSVSVFKDCADRTDLGYIEMGAEPICINCGNHHEEEGNIDCCSSGEVCECCGCRISRGDARWVGDYPYCEDCASYCEVCGEYEVNDRMTYIEREGRDVCEYCLDNYYSRCSYCGEWVHNDNTRWIESEDRYVCEDCLEDYYFQCEKCGEWFRNYDMRELDGNEYCESCYDEIVEENEEEEEAV